MDDHILAAFPDDIQLKSPEKPENPEKMEFVDKVSFYVKSG